MSYSDFLSKKQKAHKVSGFEPSILNDKLFPFQKHCTSLALKNGRFALFEDCGLGKTFQQLEWAHQIVNKTGQRVLILCPLAVAAQTMQEGEKFGIKVRRWTLGEEALYTVNHTSGIWIANYEQLEKISTNEFIGVVLDESSIIKNFTGETKKLIFDRFQNTTYKLACTATPSPNDHMELCNHAEFLNVMSRSEMLAMYFVHDGGETSKWRLKGHAEEPFWKFVSTWAIMINRPSDIGFEDDGYILPDLNISELKIETDKRENGKLFNDVAVSATNFNKELRITIVPRIDMAANIVNESGERWIAWCKQNEESELLTKKIKDSIEVVGSQLTEVKEERLLGFASGKWKCLVTKPKIAQYGLNFQTCNNQIFTALDFSFESLYQAIRRSYRFGQDKPVNILLVTTDTMTNVIKSIHEKQAQFEEMKNHLIKYQCQTTNYLMETAAS